MIDTGLTHSARFPKPRDNELSIVRRDPDAEHRTDVDEQGGFHPVEKISFFLDEATQKSINSLW
jgi:hypothetical protein